MKPEYHALLLAVKLKNQTAIERADADPDLWYELFVSEGEQAGTHTVESGDTFDEAVVEFQKYAESYGLDNVYLDVWTNRKIPEETELSFWTADLFYSILHDYFTQSDEIRRMNMNGTATYPEDGSQPTFTKDYCGEGEYFADQIAFRYFRDRVCHICEHSEPDDSQDECGIIGPYQGDTRATLVEQCGGDEKKAALLFDRLDWRSPGTLLAEWDEDNQ